MKYFHETELSLETAQFIESKLGFTPFKRESGADLQAGPYTVEVKSCREWCLTRHANGTRRRGRFHFKGWENADYYLFVLTLEDGSYKMALIGNGSGEKFQRCKRSIPWRGIFK